MYTMIKEVQETRALVSGFDYPRYFASIVEPDAEFRFEATIVNTAKGYSEKIEIASTKDCPVHLRQLVRKHLKGWQIHDDVPTTLVWQADF